MNFGLDFIKKLKPVKWNWPAPNNDGKEHFGFIAQDVDKIASRKDYGFVGMKKEYLTINYEEFIGPLAKAIKELSAEVDKINKKLKTKNF